MFKYKVQLLAFWAVLTLFTSLPAIYAETWHLGQEQNWQQVSSENDGKYLLAVAQIKKLINEGDTRAASKAIEELKKDFPKIAGADLDTFIKAEILFSKGKFTKAAINYEKFLKRYSHSELSGLYDVVLERQFAIATAFLAGEKKTVLKFFRIKGYAEGEKMMEKIADRAGDAPISKRAILAVVESFEKRAEYQDAYEKWSEISYKWPNEPIGKDALLGMARCKHAAYRGPKYDASFLVSSESYYKNYMDQIGPASQVVKEFKINDKLTQITEQRAYKEFDIGKYYQSTGSDQAANLYYQMVIDQWPGTTAAKMAKQKMNSDITEEMEK